MATDLFLLISLRSGVTRISASEWDRANSSAHFNRSEWFETYAGRGSDLIDRSLVADELRRRQEKIASNVMPFNDMTSGYADLCGLATNFELSELANELLRKAFACVISYGWRKDPTLAYVLESIEAVAAKDSAFATEMLRRISPAVANIDVTTEDSGTRPSDLAKLILTLTPKEFPAYYKHWLDSSEWYTAELVFCQFLEMQPLENLGMELATAAVWDDKGLRTIQNRADAGDAGAATVLSSNLKRFGIHFDNEHDVADRKVNTSESDPHIDFTTYAPGNLSGLLGELKEKNAYVAERRIVREWFEFWTARGHGVEVLREFDKSLNGEHIRSGVADALDSAFEASRELEGKRRAYRWIVAAQIQQRGWIEHFDKASAMARFETVARHYKANWKQFITDTTKPEHAFPPGSLIIPHERLVHFLLAVDEVSIAKEITETMVNVVVEDFAEQALPAPSWLESAAT